MKKLVAVLSLLLAACAQQPTESGNTGSAPDSEAQQRARAFTDLATAYFERAQYKIALDELRKAIIADPRFGPTYNVYGLVYMELAEDKLAEENFRRALELDRRDSVAHNNYGWFLCTRGRYDEGLAQFTAAIQNPLYTTPEQAMDAPRARIAARQSLRDAGGAGLVWASSVFAGTGTGGWASAASALNTSGALVRICRHCTVG